jgi:hypothetical protein
MGDLFMNGKYTKVEIEAIFQENIMNGAWDITSNDFSLFCNALAYPPIDIVDRV